MMAYMATFCVEVQLQQDIHTFRLHAQQQQQQQNKQTGKHVSHAYARKRATLVPGHMHNE